MKKSCKTYPPSNIIDGDKGTFTHTSPADSMWVRVILSGTARITKIVVTNRKDCCQDGIVGASLNILMGSVLDIMGSCGEITEMKDSYTFKCRGLGDRVELAQWSPVGEWYITEIEVFGYPVTGMPVICYLGTFSIFWYFLPSFFFERYKAERNSRLKI